MAAQKFDQIYSEASDELKKTAVEQNMVRLPAAVDRKLGAVKNAAANGWSVNYAPSGASVTLKFETQFERGSGDETLCLPQLPPARRCWPAITSTRTS